MRPVLAVDPGEARIGLAVSDPSKTIARPLETFRHSSRQQDAERICQKATELDVESIVVGVAYDQGGTTGPQARKSFRLIEVLEKLSHIPIIPWDESESTEVAAQGARPGQILDARAAAVILQDYLNAQSP
jgi:putative Holliday junction resolvase